MVRAEGLEPPHLSVPEPKSGASTNSATPAKTRGRFYSRRKAQLPAPKNGSYQCVVKVRLAANQLDAWPYSATLPGKGDTHDRLYYRPFQNS